MYTTIPQYVCILSPHRAAEDLGMGTDPLGTWYPPTSAPPEDEVADPVEYLLTYGAP